MRNGAHVLTSCYYWPIGIDLRTLAVIIQISAAALSYFRDSGTAFIGEVGAYLKSNYFVSAGIARILMRQLSGRAHTVRNEIPESGQFLCTFSYILRVWNVHESTLLWSKKTFISRFLAFSAVVFVCWRGFLFSFTIWTQRGTIISPGKSNTEANLRVVRNSN